MSRQITRYGWQPDLPDHRDHIYNLTASIRFGHQLPAAGGLQPDELPEIWDQGALGSCTAHGSLRVWCAEAMQQQVTLPPAPPGGAPLSRLMQYYDTRAVEGTVGYDSGGQVRDAIRVLATQGCAPETSWPYDISQFTEQPPESCYRQAAGYMSVRYQRILPGQPGAPMRTALNDRKAITFGFPVPAYFEDGSWDPSSGQPLPLPAPGSQFIGGHCVAATSYDYTERLSSGYGGVYRVAPFFTCDNSWGAGWGMAGRFNMDARWFGPLASDLWIISQVK